MKLKKILSQHRNDYTGEMECEFCHHKEIDKYGYYDNNYLFNVIPAMKCSVCGKSSNEPELNA